MKLHHTYFYHPEHMENNEAIIQHFEQQNISMQKIQNALGRNNRFILTDDVDERLFLWELKQLKVYSEKANPQFRK
jgi:3-oxoacyl-[acyl-carrier-protein] synthase-3